MSYKQNIATFRKEKISSPRTLCLPESIGYSRDVAFCNGNSPEPTSGQPRYITTTELGKPDNRDVADALNNNTTNFHGIENNSVYGGSRPASSVHGDIGPPTYSVPGQQSSMTPSYTTTTLEPRDTTTSEPRDTTTTYSTFEDTTEVVDNYVYT